MSKQIQREKEGGGKKKKGDKQTKAFTHTYIDTFTHTYIETLTHAYIVAFTHTYIHTFYDINTSNIGLLQLKTHRETVLKANE